MKLIENDDYDESQDTLRTSNLNSVYFDCKIFSKLKHAHTVKPHHCEEVKVPERSPTLPVGQVKLRHQEIANEEIEVFALAFKNKLRFPEFLRKQFDIVSLLPSTPLETVARLTMDLPLPKMTKLTNKTMVFDLDNTLIYSVPSKLFDTAKFYNEAEVCETSFVEPKTAELIYLHVVIRPYAREMLKQLSKYYEIIVFTAANKNYGEAIINVLDPDMTLIDHRLYRNKCIRLNNSFIKDLRILNKDLSTIIMIDDNIASFYNQLENGIVIPPFTGVKADAELGALWIFLRQIASSDDVRIPINSKYSLKLLYEMYTRLK